MVNEHSGIIFHPKLMIGARLHDNELFQARHLQGQDNLGREKVDGL